VAGPGLSLDGRPLSVLIANADRAGLAALVDEQLRRFTERDVLQALRHPFCGREVLEAIETSSLLRLRSVKKAFARHPAASRPTALQCLEDLTWRDLVEVGRETRTPAPVRASCVQQLLEKLPRLALGEKIALARLADRPVLPALLVEKEPRVLEAVLANPRLVEDDLVAWITTRNPLPERLGMLAGDPRWSQRRQVREALLRNPSTPRPAALALLLSGTRTEWRLVMENPSADPLLAACAERLYRERTETVDRKAARS